MVSNSKLNLDLYICAKTKMIEYRAPPQQPHQEGTIFWDSHEFDVVKIGAKCIIALQYNTDLV